MREISLTIYMEPVPKGRPRTTFKGGKAVTYTPSNTVHAENLIRDEILKIICSDPSKQVLIFSKDEPVSIEVTFYLSKPKSAKRILPTVKPDIDNFFKTTLDSIAGFVYENDSQVTTAKIKKRYGFPPRIELSLKRDPAEQAEESF